jgi:hypothetical protein
VLIHAYAVMIPLGQKMMRHQSSWIFVQIGKMPSYGRNGQNTLSMYLIQVRLSFHLLSPVLTIFLDNTDTPLPKDPSKSKGHNIPVPLDSAGVPILPHITMQQVPNPYKTRDVQDLVMDYMNLDLGMLSSYFQKASSNIYVLEQITGIAKSVAWKDMSKDPPSFLLEECYPKDFEWMHPSKIRIGEAFRLLDHWRSRIDNRQEPLIWVTSSKLFENVHRPLPQARTSRQHPVQVESSDGERFSLPHSSEIDEDEDTYANEDMSDRSEESDDDHDSVVISMRADTPEQDAITTCEQRNDIIIRSHSG